MKKPTASTHLSSCEAARTRTLPPSLLRLGLLLLPILSFALLLGPPAASGQGAKQGQNSAPLFIERVDINIINVEAFVTDQKGNSVNDLKAEDFEIFEDGKPVEISNFFQNDRVEKIEDQFERDRQLVESGRKGRSSSPVAVPAPREVPEDQRLNLVVYVDLYNLRPASRTQVLKKLGGFLEDRIYQGDRIMLVAHQRNLQMIHPFTQDVGKVIKGIEKVAGMSTNGQMMDAERKRTRNAIFQQTSQTAGLTDSSGPTSADQINAMESIRLFVQQQRLETENSMRALEIVLRSLGGLPGRRALLYISDGLEKQPGADLFQLYLDKFGTNNRDAGSLAPPKPGLEITRNDLTELFDKVAAVANTHQVTLYTMQARGARGPSSLSATEGDNSAGIGGELTANNERGMSEVEPLIDLAKETGGTAIINTANFAGALDNLSKDFSSLYSLGYRSRTGGDGKYHKIEVKVKRPGLKVRHRAGYVDSPQDQRVADRAFSSLILDLEANPLGISVDFATPQQESMNKYHLPLLVKIPLNQITLLPDGDKQKGKLRLFFAVQDPDGAISQVQEVPYPVEIPAADFEQVRDKEIGYALKLAVREGTPKIAVSVWDEVSGSESYLLRNVPVGKAAKKKTGP